MMHETSLSVSKAALRALVDCVADDIEHDGIRVGMVTIDGTMPTHEFELKKSRSCIGSSSQ
ncbi:MAG: hypothetical protein ACXVAG_14735 [Vulcanimicrobiaceae bacterium]